MSFEPNSNPSGSQIRDHNRLIRISLDLGSDTTVAYVALPGEIEYRRIDLQFFLRALASDPDLLRDGSGAPSHRLKSRYAVNAQFQSASKPVQREHSRYGYTEVLPPDHATLELIDYEKYLVEQRSAGALVQTANQPNRCFFKFIDDTSAPFAFNKLLPNAKLIFQSGVGLERQYEVRDADGLSFIKVHPVEVIKNQVCLVLQNFIRPHPILRDADGHMPSWSDCAVVLTVPNTYSPFHREVLAEAVGQTLGCEVATITESDAVVFYYIAAIKPDAGLSLDELRAMQQKYLTLDIGKGTTDLTLMSVTYKEASREIKQERGFDPAKPLALRHVHVAARTGRPSGGAKMTYILARFFECLIDDSVRHSLSELPNLTDEQRRDLKSVTRSPFRLTTRSSALQLPEDSAQSRRLLEFERLCEWYKQELDLTSNGVSIPDYKGKERPDELALYISEIVNRYVGAEFRIYLDEEQQRHISRAILEALEQPNMLKHRRAAKTIIQSLNAPPPAPAKGPRPSAVAEPPPEAASAERLAGIWAQLDKQVRDYVKENVDDVLIELANAHGDGNDGAKYEDAVEALVFMLGSTADRGAGAKRRPFKVRTHVIVAGQGSQFKPLKSRLQKLVKEAELGTILKQDELQRDSGRPEGSSEPRRGFFKRAMDFVADRNDGFVPSPNDHMAVELSGNNLKDGCARGALDWFSSDPVMENPDYVHGQLVVTLLGGGSEHWIDMDKLNDTKRFALEPEDLQVSDAWYVYYLPTKGQRSGSLRSKPGSIMGTLMSCNHIEVEIRPVGEESSQLLVSTKSNGQVRQTIKLRDALYGVEGAKELREMLWPAMLLDE